MSTPKIKSPNEKSYGFVWAIVAVIAIIIALIAYIVINGQGKQQEKLAEGNVDKVAATVSVNDNMITLASNKDSKDTPTADLYEDYSCPHCADLALATDGDMLKAVEDGKLIVNIHSLNFLDRGAEDGHSTKAGAAALAIAETGDATAYWNYRAMLMREQKNIWNKWSNADFANAAEVVKAPEDAIKNIADGADTAKMTEFATKNAQKLEAINGKVSSPRVVVDGKDIPNEDLANWVSIVSGK